MLSDGGDEERPEGEKVSTNQEAEVSFGAQASESSECISFN